jgi:hypothetical protein
VIIPEKAHTGWITWVPDDADVPSTFVIQTPTTVEPGLEFSPDAWVVQRDGKHRRENVSLQSSDARAIAPLREGFTANRIRRAWIRLLYDGVATESTLVTVRSARPATEVLNQEIPQQNQWLPVGKPAFEIVERSGESVISLPGDRNYSDGTFSRQKFDGRYGLALELEFAIAVTKDDKQQIRISLCRGDYAPAAKSGERFFQEVEGTGIAYPAESGVRFNAFGYTTYAFGVAKFGVLSSKLGTGAWHKLRISLLPDGSSEVMVDGETLPAVGAKTTPSGEGWRVCLFGDAVGTEALVRRIHLWSGMR